MNFVFCGAHHLILFALYLKNQGKKVTIVTDNEDVAKYCKDEKLECIHFPLIILGFSSIYKIFTFKKMLDKIVKKIDIKKGDSFFLLGNFKGYDFFYLTKELSEKGQGYYKCIDKELERYVPSKWKPFFFRGAICRFLMKLVLGLDLVYYSGTNGDPALGIDDNFMRRYNIKDYAPDISAEKILLDAVKKNKTNYKEYDNVILDQGPHSVAIEPDSVEEIYKKILKLPIDFAFKKHPQPLSSINESYKEFHKIFEGCEEVPIHIPVELMCNNINKSIISVSTMGLITASQLKHLKVISLMDLVNWRDLSWKNKYKDILKKSSKNKILFPKSFEELKEILLN